MVYKCKRCLKEFKYRSKLKEHLHKKRVCKIHEDGEDIDYATQLIELEGTTHQNPNGRFNWKKFKEEHGFKLINNRPSFFCSKCSKRFEMTKVTFKSHFENCIQRKNMCDIKLNFSNMLENNKYIIKCDFLETIIKTFYNPKQPQKNLIGKYYNRSNTVKVHDYMGWRDMNTFELYRIILEKYINQPYNLYGKFYKMYAGQVFENVKNIELKKKKIDSWCRPIKKQVDLLSNTLKFVTFRNCKLKDSCIKTLDKDGFGLSQLGERTAGEWTNMYYEYINILKNNGNYRIKPAKHLIEKDKRFYKSREFQEYMKLGDEELDRINEARKKKYYEKIKEIKDDRKKVKDEYSKEKRSIRLKYIADINKLIKNTKINDREDLDKFEIEISKNANLFTELVNNKKLLLEERMRSRFMRICDKIDKDFAKDLLS
jgi:DNA-directed RNA polymerase subunit RPC12/RpoP